MDKLQPQTVYVPVAVKERLPNGEKDVFVLYDDGDMNTLPTEFINKRMVIVESWLEKQEGVYPLTGKELKGLFEELKEALSDRYTIDQFLKSKGIEI